MPEERKLTEKEIEIFYKNNRDKVKTIINIFCAPGNSLIDMGVKINDLIDGASSQKEKDILTAAVLSIFKQIIFKQIRGSSK